MNIYTHIYTPIQIHQMHIVSKFIFSEARCVLANWTSKALPLRSSCKRLDGYDTSLSKDFLTKNIFDSQVIH